LKRKNVYALFLFLFSLALINYYQNCTGGSEVAFSGRSSFQSASTGGFGGYDGKPGPGSYCRVFDSIPCQTQVANLQSTLNVDSTDIQLTSDKCTSTASNFEFNNIAVTISPLNKNFIGLSRGIFKKCELNTPPTDMPDAWCRSKNSDVDVVINKNLATKNLDLNLIFRNSSGIRSVSSNLISKTQSNGSTVYASTREKFELNITNSISQTSPAKMNVLIDEVAMNVDLDCHQASPGATIIIEKDLELHPSWIDTTRLAGYWKLNEVNAISNATFLDSSSYGSNGTLFTNDGNNKSVLTALGTALNFDGTNDYIDIPDPADNHLDFDTRSFTFMVWMKKPAMTGTFELVFYKGAWTPSTAGYEIECLTRCMGQIGDGTNLYRAVLTSDINPYLGNWVHLAVVVDRNSRQLRSYFNGSPADVIDITAAGNVSNIQTVNFSQSASPFLGILADGAIFNGALSDTEVTEIFQRSRPKFY
jgi:hypothetical protein